MPNGVRLGFVAEEIKVAVAGILLVSLLSIATNVLSWLSPASPAIYFFLWAFVLVPIALVVIGAFGAKAAYFACMGPNRSIALSVIVALVSAIGGTVLWMLASPVAVVPDSIGQYLSSREAGSYVDLAPLLIVYGLAGSIGGIYDYYISRGRPCEVRPGKGM
jgi:hypothetical protein